MAPAIRLLIIAPMFMLMSCTSSPPDGKLIHGALRRCPEKPNCVSSETNHPTRNSVQPIRFQGNPALAWQQLTDVVQALGGEIVINDNVYLWAVFRSKFFRFIDDLEIRMDSSKALIHIRSGARTGYTDLEVNKKRVLEIKSHFQNLQEKKT